MVIILFKLSNIEIISWSGKTLHLIFLKYWVGHFFIWKELIKLMEIWEVTLLNRKWEQDLLLISFTYLGAIDKMTFKMRLKKDKFCVGFLIIRFTKQFHYLLRSGFLMGKWKVPIITLLASFKFSSGIFINHCSANMLQT